MAKKKQPIELEKEIYIELEETKWGKIWRSLLLYPIALLSWIFLGIIFIILAFIPILNASMFDGIWADEYGYSKLIRKKIIKNNFASNSENEEVYMMAEN